MDIAALYQSGLTLAEVSTQAGMAPATLRRRLVALGIPMRRKWKRPGRARKPMDEDRLRLLAAEGMSTREIAAALTDVSDECVRERMIALGIPRLPAKARMEKNHFWKNGRTRDVDGYWRVMSPGHPLRDAQGYVREHRLVMEQVLGRYLTRIEVVDHIDGDTGNNSPENLRLFATNADHLAATLKGRCPKWTEDGRRRIREGHLSVKRKASSIPSE